MSAPNITNNSKAFVVVGRIGRPYGLHGWQHIQSFTQPAENLFEYKNWYILQKNEWLPFKLDAHKLHGKEYIIHLDGIQTKEEAALYSNKQVAVLRSHLPRLNDGEFYWSDLEGLNVVTCEGIRLGTVQYLYENTGIDVMVVKPQQDTQDRERHIPFIWQETVKDVDFIDHQITVDWDYDIA